MNENLRNSPSAIRACILYEFAGGKPIFETYKKLCKRIGDNTIDYVDFEYWFMRFANGKFDLNHDRSLDPKTRSLSDMPTHILQKIINEFDLTDRFIMRHVSKNFKHIIDRWNWVPACKRININIGKNSAYLHFNDIRVAYNNNYKKLKNHNCTVKYPKSETPIESDNNGKLAIDDLQIVLKNPKIELDKLNVISLNEEFNREFKLMLKSLNQKIHVKSVFISTRYPHSGVAIISHLETGTLQEIELSIGATDEYRGVQTIKSVMEKIKKFDQFKHAKMLTLITNLTTNAFPIRSFLQCRRFTIDFYNCILNKTVLKCTRAILKFTVLEVAILKIGSVIRFNGSSFLNQFDRRAIEVPDRPNVRRVPIPKSNEFFEIQVYEDTIRIERTL